MIVVIPSRYSSTRFPGKPLADMGGRPMIQVVYENASRAASGGSVVVATDDRRIYDAVLGFGGDAMMTSPKHSNGTERVRECVDRLGLPGEELVVNLQGDEPLLQPEAIGSLVGVFEDGGVEMASLMRRCDDPGELSDRNVVKVVTDLESNAIYFSRYPIPYDRDGSGAARFAHVGVYGYRKRFLDALSLWERTPLEKAELLEQLRVLEHGAKIRMVEVEYDGFGIDTPEQLQEAIGMMEVSNG